jgi:hypothetical protein
VLYEAVREQSSKYILAQQAEDPPARQESGRVHQEGNLSFSKQGGNASSNKEICLRD